MREKLENMTESLENKMEKWASKMATKGCKKEM